MVCLCIIWVQFLIGNMVFFFFCVMRNMYIKFLVMGIKLVLYWLVQMQMFLRFLGCGRLQCYMNWLVQCGLGVLGNSMLCVCENILFDLIIMLQWLVDLFENVILMFELLLFMVLIVIFKWIVVLRCFVLLFSIFCRLW